VWAKPAGTTDTSGSFDFYSGDSMNYMKSCRLAALSTILSLASVLAMAQDTPATRQAAADRYLRAVPIATMLDDTFREIGKQVPADQRVQFIADMKKVVRAEFVEKVTRDAMVKIFTTDELNALADFYTAPQGASAMRKMGVYMAEVMPTVQAEVQRGVQEILRERQEKSAR
jgi:hypothetical protein